MLSYQPWHILVAYGCDIIHGSPICIWIDICPISSSFSTRNISSHGICQSCGMRANLLTNVHLYLRSCITAYPLWHRCLILPTPAMINGVNEITAKVHAWIIFTSCTALLLFDACRFSDVLKDYFTGTRVIIPGKFAIRRADKITSVTHHRLGDTMSRGRN